MVEAAQIDLGGGGESRRSGSGRRWCPEVREADAFGSSRHGCQRGDPGRQLDRWIAAGGGWRSGRSGAAGSLPKGSDGVAQVEGPIHSPCVGWFSSLVCTQWWTEVREWHMSCNNGEKTRYTSIGVSGSSGITEFTTSGSGCLAV